MGVDVILPRNINAQDQWSRCSYVIAQSGDRCKPDSWVFFKTPCDSSPVVDEVCVKCISKVTLTINYVTGFCGENCFDSPVQDYQS